MIAIRALQDIVRLESFTKTVFLALRDSRAPDLTVAEQRGALLLSIDVVAPAPPIDTEYPQALG